MFDLTGFPPIDILMFGFIFIIAMMWNAINLLIMDWLIFCTIAPKWVVIEGTEGCGGYKDYMYHFKGFLIGCIYTTIMAVIIASIDYLIVSKKPFFFLIHMLV